MMHLDISLPSITVKNTEIEVADFTDNLCSCRGDRTDLCGSDARITLPRDYCLLNCSSLVDHQTDFECRNVAGCIGSSLFDCRRGKGSKFVHQTFSQFEFPNNFFGKFAALFPLPA